MKEILVIQRTYLCCPGFAAEGHPDVVGELDHGHAGVPCPRHGAAQRGAARTQAVRPHQASHLPHHDEEHLGTLHIPAYSHLRAPFCWYVC